jgi:hypothetical protein
MDECVEQDTVDECVEQDTVDECVEQDTVDECVEQDTVDECVEQDAMDECVKQDAVGEYDVWTEEFFQRMVFVDGCRSWYTRRVSSTRLVRVRLAAFPMRASG